MPAFRKSARDRDFRSQQRSSATPYASPAGTPSDSICEKKQRSITEWTEPQPQQPAPSFEEHGFARHGVLENMAPLGIPPKARDKQRARTLGELAPRYSLMEKSSALFGNDVEMTPEVTPAPELEPDFLERPEEEVPAVYPLLDEEEDDDYEPAKVKKKARVSKTPVRGKTPVQNNTSINGRISTKNGHAQSPSMFASPAVQAVQISQPVDANQQRLLIAVNDAVSRANKNDRKSLAVALKELYEESKFNANLTAVLNSIILQNSTTEQFEEFRVRVRAIKKRCRRENEGGVHKVQAERSSRRTSRNDSGIRSNQNSSARASSEIVGNDLTDLTSKESRRALQSALEQAHPFSTAPALPATESSAESTPRRMSRSPRKRTTTNGARRRNSEIDLNGEMSISAPTPGIKSPPSGLSDSELSDVNEEIVQKGSPESAHRHEKFSNSAAATSSRKGKSAANSRVARKSKSQAVKAVGKYATKPQPLTAEELAEDDRIRELRKSLAEQQPIRKFENADAMMSDVRFDDEILETESLTESQIAVGPPVESEHQRCAAKNSNQRPKRARDDNSRQSSPALLVTRPSTPAIGPPSKRIRLTNGQSARTKRSPVKNREGNPIAGVAFNGGGGSRQLGPDDYDANSPQSDSDDYCSACRGGGEFVCCETCPRVFHLICCDPPLVEVPTGAFYCNECSARLHRHDGPAADSYTSLGPLFKLLNRANSRAFALPQKIRDNYEGVSTKADGSYAEDTQKFPLARNSGYGYQKPDYTRIFDGDSSIILCIQCGLSSGGKRHMLKCDFCDAYWHLDCVDPPLANPPHISLEASTRDAWRCPRHIEHDLRSGLLNQNDLSEVYDDIELDEDQDQDQEDVAPAPRVTRKVRKPRDLETIEPTFLRGMRNNGLIEIINDSDDDTDGEGNYVFGPQDVNSKTFRVPEKGVVLDFLGKIKSGRIAKNSEARESANNATQRKGSMQNFLAHSIQQQQAALNLAHFAQRESDLDFGEGKVASLILTLTSEAPANVINAFDSALAPALAEQERAELLKLQELIKRRLGA